MEAFSSSTSKPARPLAGLRLVITGLDLQQSEHRGIATYSKAMLSALASAGAELWLLTEFQPKLRGRSLSTSPKAVRREVFAARVLEALNTGSSFAPIPLAAGALARRSSWARKALRAWQLLLELPGYLLLKSRYNLSKAWRVDLLHCTDNPYLRVERLSYLQDLTGLLCTKNIFTNAYRSAAGQRNKPLSVRLGDYDALITTCPLHLAVEGPKPCLQTIHDLIPLEYAQHLDHAGAFSKRLESCLHSNRLYVSQATREKFTGVFGLQEHTSEATLIQPPSLLIDSRHHDLLAHQDQLTLPKQHKGGNSSLRPFQYLLFNSSVEPRKNLLFVIKAFRRSGLPQLGIKLCVTGMLKGDAYSRAVASQADASVVLTGYLDETTKTQLYLNALVVVSPSLVEGFGIPVLDAACLGVATIASPSNSHLEIQALQDFQSLIWICDTVNPLDWALAMQQLAVREQANLQDAVLERRRRLERYAACSQQIQATFQDTLCEQVLAAVESAQAHTKKGS